MAAARDAEALRLYEGLTYREISERLGWKSKVSAINAVKRARARDEARDAEALRLRDADRSYEAIARQLGWRSPTSAKRAIGRARCRQAADSTDVGGDQGTTVIAEPEDPIKALRVPVCAEPLVLGLHQAALYERFPDLRVCLEPIPEDLPDVCRCEYEEYDEHFDCDHGPPMSMRLEHQLRPHTDAVGWEIFGRYGEVRDELVTRSREDERAHVLSMIGYEPGLEHIDTEQAPKATTLRLVDNGAPAPMRQALGDAELIDRYVQHIRRRNLAPTTVKSFADCLRLFAKEHEGNFGTATRESVQALLDTRGGRERGAKSMTPGRRYWWLACLHGFYAWAVNEELLESDPTAKIQRPKRTKKLPRPMPDDDLALAIVHADPMMKCWILLGAYEGLRCQEIAGLSREDVIEHDMKLRVVYGKGRKQRMLPLNPEVLAALQALPMPTSGPLFRRKQMLDRYPPAALAQELGLHLRGLGISSTAHTLRHWFGTAFYNETRDLRLTQEMMGHEDPATTALYTQPDWQRTAPAVASLGVKNAVIAKALVVSERAQIERRVAEAEKEAAAAAWRAQAVPVPVFETAAARDAEALRLRELQHSYREIARKLGWAAPNSAFEAVRRARANEATGKTTDTDPDSR